MKAIAGFLRDLKLNFSPGTAAFYMMRLTGIAIAVFLIIHLYSVGQAVDGQAAFDRMMEGYDNTLGHWMEYFILLAVLFHAANGFRVIVADFFSLTRRQKELLWGTMTAAFVIAMVSIWRFLL